MSSVASSQVLAPSGISAKKSVVLQTSIAAMLCVGIALYFWVDSRYPSLLKKLHSGKGIHISGALSFDALMPVKSDMSLATRIAHTTVNWMYTNRIGMTFGICFGAAALTLLPLLPRRRFRNEFANTLAGAATGVPLGVCANCAAPVGQSLYQAGAAPATVLATMISSPTLNVVVLAMMFALFPFPVALLRLATPVVLIALVPWLTRRVQPIDVSCDVPQSAGWLRPTADAFKQYFVNLGKLALTTVPLMILAGVLGALLVELAPARDIPTSVSVVGIVLLALIGAFLPVPIAFDVAASFLLLSRGVPLPYVVTLLCTLGACSVYSVLILGRTISWKTALSVYGAVALVGAVAGLGTAVVQAAIP